MLKFADLSGNFKSYKKSLDSYIKLFPDSYMPLLVMYLSREGFLKLVTNHDAHDPRILYHLEKDDLEAFLVLDKEWIRALRDFTEFAFSEDLTLKEDFFEKNEANSIDFLALATVYQLILFLKAEKCKSVSIVLDIPNDSPLNKVTDIIIQTCSKKENAALFFYSYMIMTRYEHKSNEDKWDKQFWFEEFEETFNKIQSHSRIKELAQPKELTQLVLSRYRRGSIYNPFAGIASYAVQLHYELGEPDFYPSNGIGNYYYAEEINELTWAVGKLFLMASYSDSVNYILGDSTNNEEWKGEVGNVISTPPFGYIITNEKGEKELADHFVVRRGIDFVCEGGLVACVVPLSFLYRKDTADIRQKLVDNQWLESIVFLPEKLFSYSRIKSVVLFIHKEKQNKMIMVDGTTSILSKGKVNILDSEKIANMLLEGEYDPHSAYYDSDYRMEDDLPISLYNKLRCDVFFDEIKKNDYNLAPGNYFNEIVSPKDGFRLVKLEDLVAGYAFPINENGVGKLIKPNMLSSELFTPLSDEHLEEGEYDRTYNAVTQDALLISPLGNIRPTLLKYNGGSIVYRRDHIYAVYIDSNRIIPEYLHIELLKDYVADQLRLKYTGDVINHLSLKDFLSIFIQVPDRHHSQALVIEKEIVEEKKLLHFAKLEKELSELKDKQHDEYVKMLRQRKHRIQQVMNEFSPAFSMLNQLRKENGGILRDVDIVATRTGKTVGEYFDKLESIIVKVEDLVTSLTDKEQWKEPEPVDIERFIRSIPQNHISEKFVFQIVDDNDTADLIEGILPDFDRRLVLIDPNDLSTVFDNIINNAIKYGFTESIRKDYVIRISLISEIIDNQPSIRIYVDNNGIPIHPSVDRNRFFDWGYGTNTGIGTWEAKSIIEHYGGTIALNEYPDEEAGFQTEYDIVLPLIKSEEWKSKLG